MVISEQKSLITGVESKTPVKRKTNKASIKKNGCKAYPKGQEMTDGIHAWCKQNMHKAMCINCYYFPKGGPEQSIYQKEKERDSRT